MAFATGKHAKFISDRSGFSFPYSERIREWNGLVVHISEYEAKHPQLEAPRVTQDAQALKDARPQGGTEAVNVKLPGFNLETVQRIPSPLMTVQAGTLSTSGTVTVAPVSVTLTGLSATVSAGSLSAQGNVAVTPTGVSATVSLGTLSVSASTLTTYTVTVSSDGYGNKYYIAGLSGAAPTLTLNEGSTYRFDQSDSSNSGHPLRFSTTSNGTHAGGSEYTTGVTTNGTPGSAGAYTQITVASSAPTLYYYCTNHSGMGGTANTP